VLIGRRDTGKSFLIQDLMYYHQDIPIGTVISGTEAGNNFFGEHVPKLFIHDQYNTAICVVFSYLLFSSLFINDQADWGDALAAGATT
jgi:hypothetical protein